MTALVDYHVTGGRIARVTLNDPKRRNALSDALLDDLFDALERARDDDDVRVVVLGSSHDRIFSAGGDLKAFASDAPAITYASVYAMVMFLRILTAQVIVLLLISLAESSILTEFGWLTFVVCCATASRELSWRSALATPPRPELEHEPPTS